MYQPARSSLVAATLAGEASKPANCFTVSGMSPVSEGIHMSLENTYTGPAVFVGDRYVKRNSRDGCHYHMLDAHTGLVRRAVVEWLDLPNKKPIPLLVQPYTDTKTVLVHVNVAAISVPGKLHQEFYQGIQTTGAVVAQDVDQMLVQLNPEDELVLFFQDGMVRAFVLENGTLCENPLTIEDMARERVEYLLFTHTEAVHALMDDSLVEHDQAKHRRTRDWAQHQLCSILAVGGKRSPDVFALVYHQLLALGKNGHLQANSTREHALRVVSTINSRHLDEMTEAFLPSKFSRTVQYQPLPGHAPRKGAPQERRSYLIERAILRAEQAPKKGPTGQKPNPHGNKKKAA